MKVEQLPKEITALLQPLISEEYKAFYTYKAISNFCRSVGFFQAADFFQKEADNELQHSAKIQSYLVDWNVLPALPPISPTTFTPSLKGCIEAAYKMEYALYEVYEDVSYKILEKEDICTFDFLQEFRTLQTKSVAEYSDMLNMLEGEEDDKMNMLLLEKKLF